ncbi:DMT family transporter [Peribacillus asahii]|uniref:DMT family transporter n=1 Tax=Peribacillus asahii TaxID=228899 RepID=UPI0038106D30
MENIKVISMIAIISLIWGYLWVTVKIGLEDIPPLLFSSLRLLIGAIILLVVLLVRKQKILPSKQEWKPFFYLSLLMCIGYYALSTYGMQFVDSGISSVLVYTMPIIVSILAHFYLKEHLTLNKNIGLIVGAVGLLFIMGPKLMHISWNVALFGEIIILISAFFWACTNIYTKKIGSSHDKLKMTMWQLLIGGFLLLIISLIGEHDTVFNMTLSLSSILALLYNGVLGSAVAFVGWNWVLGKVQASVASISLMSVPILGLVFGWLQLNEQITVNIVIGAVFVCLGILFTSVQSKKKVENVTEKIA